MANTPQRSPFISFKSIFSNTPHYRKFEKFLQALDEFAALIDPQGNGGDSTTIIISPPTGGGGTGGGGDTGNTQIISNQLPVELPDNPGIPRGMAVSYRRNSVVLATNTDPENPANFAVGYKAKGKMYLYGQWHLGELLLAPGAGSATRSTLYLATGGLCTDDEASLTQPDAFKQELGTLLGLSGVPPFGFTRCVFAPRILYL